MLFLWDEIKDYILASKYDPLFIGTGEAGLAKEVDEDEVSTITECNSSKTKTTTSKSPIPKKGKSSIDDEAREMVKTVVSLVMDDNKSHNTEGSTDIEKQSLSDLTELYKMYMSNLKFHKDNGTLSTEREKEMIGKIDYIFEIIENRSKCKKRARDDNLSTHSNVS